MKAHLKTHDTNRISNDSTETEIKTEEEEMLMKEEDTMLNVTD
jgi:hypothetical protein